MIENTTFPHKIALSKADFMTYRMWSTKWTYRKERSFATTYLTFFENFSRVTDVLSL